MRSVHDCDQCEYSASDYSYLKKHIDSKHKGLKYNCGQCEFVATSRNSLKHHNGSKH